MGKQEIAQKMKKSRQAAGLTQAEVASFLGTTYQAVSNYERGKNSIDSETLKKMCDLYAVDLIETLSENEKNDLDLKNLIRLRRKLKYNQKVRQTTYNGYKKRKLDPEIDFLAFESITRKYEALDHHGKVAVLSILDVEYNRCISLNEEDDTK